MLSVWHKADIYRIPIYAPVTWEFVWALALAHKTKAGQFALPASISS